MRILRQGRGLGRLVLVASLLTLATSGSAVGSGLGASGKSAPSKTRTAGCTLYVAPNGTANNAGTSPSRPLTIAAANSRSVPGSVICVAAGSYTTGLVQVHSGSSSAWIVWRSYDGTPVIHWDPHQSHNLIFKVSDGAAYVAFRGLAFDGASIATAAVGCYNHSHHVRVVDSTIRYMGSAGISAVGCDYLTIVGNTVYRFGDNVGWSSGISLNWSSGAFWYDQAPGFHNVIADNFITGGVDNSSHHSDGNGIILDLGGNISPTLVTDNVVYMNGGRGITTLQTTGKVYVVNNTLYKNGLDLRMAGIGEAAPNSSANQVWANNAVYAWQPRYTYQLLGGSTGIMYRRDSSFGGLGTKYLPQPIAANAAEVASANPRFTAAPDVNPSADGQWRNPPTPASLAGGLSLAADSPLVGAGVDPRTLPGLDPAMLAGIDKWAMTAINGKARPVGGAFDVGAYER